MGILTEDMKRVVREQRLGFIATVCPDGTPNLSPKGTTAVLDDDHLVFADLRSPQTIRNLRANPGIEINVVDQFVRKGYRFKGTAEVLTEGVRFDEVVASFQRDREIDPARVRAVVVMAVTKAEPLISPAYDMGSTEEELKKEYKRYFAELYGPF
jgi:hypothetical protein